MNIINYISIVAIPFTIFFIISYGLLERVKVFDSFIIGAKEGIDTVVRIFPTLIALFLSISALENSGILNLFTKIFSPILTFFKIPSEILPLMLIRPISGSASTAVAMNIMEKYGVDTIIRFNNFYHYGFNRNHSLYNCNIYQRCRNKKNTLCFIRSSHY